jgi:outer membrane protein
MKSILNPLCTWVTALALGVVCSLSLTSTASAQRVGFVDTEYILSNMAEYQAAQQEVELTSQAWQAEYEKMRKNAKDLFDQYQAERVLLSDDVRLQREQAIQDAELKAAKYRQDKFGFSGELFQFREEKVRPIQDKVFQAIEEIATEKKADFILDKSGSMTILFTNPAYDYSPFVMKKLGIQEPAPGNK